MTEDRQLLNEILCGHTHSIWREGNGQAEGGMAYLFFKDEKTAFLKRGTEGVLRGSWQPSAQGFDVKWENGPSREWILDKNDLALSFSLDGAGLIGVSENWEMADSQNLEAEFNKGGE
ncbi:MAG: hypothetical protein OCD03_00670 [Hyphomicrobiales bacterium]